MARTGVTYHEVAQAAERIRAQGHNPTVDRVLAQLGSGSKSTLAPLLKQWKAKQGGEASLATLPVDVVNAVRGLHEQLQQRAEHAVAQAREEFEALAADLRSQLSQDAAEIDSLKADNQTLKDRIQTQEANNAELKTKLEQKCLEAATRGVELAEVRAQLNEAKTMIEQWVQELRQAQSHFEHYQEQMAEDRQRERGQHRYSQQQLEGRIQELTQHLNRELARGNALEVAKQQAHQHNARLRQAFDQAQKEKQEALFDRARKDETINSLRSAKADLKARMLALESQHQALIGVQAKQKAANRMVEQQFAESRDRLKQLEDENKHLLQEKARLEGQLNQSRQR